MILSCTWRLCKHFLSVPARPLLPFSALIEMNLTVLIDNNTLTERYFLAEPGVSYLIEDEGRKIVFDVGYSDAFTANAGKLSSDPMDIDFLVLSHGHLDHTVGGPGDVLGLTGAAGPSGQRPAGGMLHRKRSATCSGRHSAEGEHR